MQYSNISQTSNLFNAEYFTDVLPKVISKEKFNSYFNSLYLQKLNSISNLIDLPSKTKEEIKTYFSFLTTVKKEFYTNCGNVLISLNPEPIKFQKINNSELSYFTLNKWCESTVNKPFHKWPSHIYTFSDQVYNSMVQQNTDQVISLTGNIGSGKSYNLNKIIQYLFFISSKNEINKEIYNLTIKSIKMMSILGSVFRDGNVDSSVCGFVYHLGFNEKNEISSFDIDSEILDCTMPFSENGRSFTLLHGFFLTQGENMGFGRQIFNFFKKYFKNFSVCSDDNIKLKYYSKKDIEIWQLFSMLSKEFLTEKEYNQILKIFYIILLCNEVTILKNKKIVNGKKFETYYINKNQITKKIANLLNIDEKKFVEAFIKCSTLQQHKTVLVSIMKYSYLCVHDFILNKVKLKLNQNFASAIKKNSIHIIDFPGQIKDETLGGLIMNFSNECLNLYSITNYTSMLSVLEENGIKLKRFEAPLSFEIIKALVGENGLLTLFNSDNNIQANNKQIKKIVTKNDNMPNIIEYLNHNNIVKISFSFQSIYYSFNDLQMETYTLSPPGNILKLLKNSKNDIYSINNSQNDANIVISDFAINKLKYLLCGLENIEPFVVCCLGIEDLHNNSARNFFKRTIIYSVLDWEWYGYEEWMKVEDFVKEFNGSYEKVKGYYVSKDKINSVPNDTRNEESSKSKGGDKCEICRNIIIVLSLENECKVGNTYVVMKKGTYRNIKKIFSALIDSITYTENLVSNNTNKNKYYYTNLTKGKPLSNSKKKIMALIKEQKRRRNSNSIQSRPSRSIKSIIKPESKETNRPNASSGSNLITVSKLGKLKENIDITEENKYGIDILLNGLRLTERNKNNVIISNENDYKNIKTFFDINKQLQSKPFDITIHLPFIIKIQSRYRGYIIRKKVLKMFRYVKYNIILLQKNIRGFLLRMKFYKFLECLKRIIILQVFFKGRYQKKRLSAILIQRYFRKKILGNENYIERKSNSSQKKNKLNEKASINELLNETDKSKIINYILLNSQFVNESKFKMDDGKNCIKSNLYYYLKDLEKKNYPNNKKTKKGEKFEDRLIQYGKNLRIRNLQRLSNKMSNELNDYTFHPQINHDYSLNKYNGTFHERNQKFLQEKNDKINLLKEIDFYTTNQKCTFHPQIIDKDGKKRKIDDLFEWQEKINKEKEDMKKLYQEYENQQVEYYSNYKNKKSTNLSSQINRIKGDFSKQKKSTFNEEDIYFTKNPENYINSENTDEDFFYQPSGDSASDIWPHNLKKDFLI